MNNNNNLNNDLFSGLSMNFPMENFKFGKVEMEGFGISMGGALSYKGKVFSRETSAIVVSPSFENVPFIYAFPTTELRCGDIVLRNDRPYMIIDDQHIYDGYKAVDLEYDKVEKILPEKYMGSFQIYTKVFSPFDQLFNRNRDFSNSPENNTGNLLPLLFFSQLGGNNNENNMNNILPLLFMSQCFGSSGDSNGLMSLMMLSFLSGNGGMNLFGGMNDKNPNKEEKE